MHHSLVQKQFSFLSLSFLPFFLWFTFLHVSFLSNEVPDRRLFFQDDHFTQIRTGILRVFENGGCPKRHTQNKRRRISSSKMPKFPTGWDIFHSHKRNPCLQKWETRSHTKGGVAPRAHPANPRVFTLQAGCVQNIFIFAQMLVVLWSQKIPNHIHTWGCQTAATIVRKRNLENTQPQRRHGIAGLSCPRLWAPLRFHAKEGGWGTPPDPWQTCWILTLKLRRSSTAWDG